MTANYSSTLLSDEGTRLNFLIATCVPVLSRPRYTLNQDRVTLLDNLSPTALLSGIRPGIKWVPRLRSSY